jgi:hypothetical protein
MDIIYQQIREAELRMEQVSVSLRALMASTEKGLEEAAVLSEELWQLSAKLYGLRRIDPQKEKLGLARPEQQTHLFVRRSVTRRSGFQGFRPTEKREEI